MKPQDYAARTRYRPPASWYRRLNSVGVAATSAGFAPRDAITLEVVGRTSGQLRRVPVLRTTHGGTDHLVSLAGESQWVRNVRAADGRAVIRRRRARPVRLTELPVEERAPVIATYLRSHAPRRPGASERQARSYFGLAPSASLEEIAAVAEYYPVFRITDARGAGGTRPDGAGGTRPDGAGGTKQEASGPAATRDRPAAVSAAVGTLGLLGVTAVGGGIEMWAFPHGNRFVPGAWLDEVPAVRTWRLPGAVLGGVFGAGGLATASAMHRRTPCSACTPLERRTGRHWSWTACVGLGVALEAWLAAEVALLPERSPVEVFYAVVGGALIGLPLLPSARRHLAA